MSSEKAGGRTGGRMLLRYAFWFYAALLFTATHWPNLKIEVSNIERPDLIVHLGCFGTWSFLLWASGLAEPRGAMKTIVVVWVVGVAYAAVDEGLQAIPWVHRTAAWDDYVADVLGITLGTLAALGAAWWWKQNTRTAEVGKVRP